MCTMWYIITILSDIFCVLVYLAASTILVISKMLDTNIVIQQKIVGIVMEITVSKLEDKIGKF